MKELQLFDIPGRHSQTHRQCRRCPTLLMNCSVMHRSNLTWHNGSPNQVHELIRWCKLSKRSTCWAIYPAGRRAHRAVFLWMKNGSSKSGLMFPLNTSTLIYDLVFMKSHLRNFNWIWNICRIRFNIRHDFILQPEWLVPIIYGCSDE